MVNPDPEVKLKQPISILFKMKDALLKEFKEKKEKLTFREAEDNPGGILLYM